MIKRKINLTGFILMTILFAAALIFTGCSAKQSGAKTEPASRVVQVEQSGASKSSAKTEAETSDEYFPTTAGLFKRFEGSGESWEETVEKQELYNGKKVVPIHTKMLNVQENPEAEGGEITLSDFTNLYVVGTEVLLVGTRASLDDNQISDEPIPVPSVILKMGLKKGQVWTYNLYNPPGKVRATVDGFETLETKAGTFERTAKIKLDYAYLDEGGREVKATLYEWYAPGYGKVKSQGDGEMGTAEVVEIKKGD